MPAHNTKKLLTTYLRRLTNLAGNNRMIFLPRLSGDQFLDLHSLSQLNGEPSFSILESLIAQKKKFLCPLVDARMEAANDASKKLKQLLRADHFVFEERGAKDLFIGWPWVEGKYNDGTLVRCPLLFFPVELFAEQGKWWIQLREEAEITFNKSFVLGYSFYNQLQADELLLEETFDELEADSTAFRLKLYQLLQKSSLDIHFNPDTYRDELTFFESVKTDDFDAGHANGMLKLFPKAVLGIFPQAGSFLVPDYLHLLNQNEFTDLEDFFKQRSPAKEASGNFLKLIKEDKMYPIFPMDEWQENALKASKLGHSVVVQGPPGTGKSQLICNLISDAMATGQRTLVVCQKRAALDVVYNRMSQEGFSDFLGLVHDFRSDRKEIYTKVARQIDRIDEYKTKNNSFDTIQLERNFLHASRRIDQITEELEEFRSALFDEKECGRSIKELYLNSNAQLPCINLKQEYQLFDFRSSTEDFLRILKAYAGYAQIFAQPNYCWLDRKSFANHSVSDLHPLREAIKKIPEVFDRVASQLQQEFGTTLDLEQCEEILEKETEAKAMLGSLQSETVFSFFLTMLPEPAEVTSALWLSNMERVTMECFHQDGPESSIPSAQLGQLQEALYRSLKARRSLLGLIRWKLFSKDKFLITRALLANGLENNRAGFDMLERKLDNRLNLEHNITKLKAKAWLTDIPESISPSQFKNWFARESAALQAKLIFTSLRGFKNIVDPAFKTFNEFHEKINKLYHILEEIPKHANQWQYYLTPSQVKQLTIKPDFAEVLVAALQKDFDSLQDFDKIQESLKPEQQSTIQKLFETAGSWQEEVLKKLFLNSLHIAWIDHLETKYPVLRMVSSEKLQQLELELRERLEEKQKISTDILLLRARERVIDDLEFNRLNNRVTYRDLHHQVTKKKKIWPIRKLVTEFEREIFKLMPCWLASPESVSAIFPMKQQFDLVIFDEASQCFTERGIPALYRGKQTVIAGDGKQLRPGDFYQVRWSEDDNGDDPNLEIDSLLELGQRYLTSLSLRSHYRSQSLELIHFSNHHFYNGKLQMLPFYQTSASPAIEYHQVNGEWKNNTNLVEAETIASRVVTLTRDCPEKNIGIVTFNAPQQMLVMDVLEEKFASLQMTIPSSLFVKNIENVQGDERDFILFSIGYAPNKLGKVNAQFGSLNAHGGENRLNVAITRAREKIIIVSSLLPHQLEVAETINDGPRLLKSYLQFALDVSKGMLPSFEEEGQSKSSGWYLKNELKKWTNASLKKYILKERIFPYYDLVLFENENPRALLLTDDEFYYEALSAKTFHAFTPALAEHKKWRLQKIYSRQYWQDSEQSFLEISKLTNTK